MATVNLVMPKLGESIMEATILRWHKKPGEAVRLDETVLDIATDKVDSEVPSTAQGVIEEILFAENDTVPVGSTIARIRVEAPATQTEDQRQPVNTPSYNGNGHYEEEALEVPYVPQNSTVAKTQGARFYSPLVLNIAANEGIGLGELEHIEGTGNEGRVTKRDILQYIQNRNGQPKTGGAQMFREKQPAQPIAREKQTASVSREAEPAAQSAEEPAQEETTVTYSGNAEIIEMDRMRKLIAKHMVDSKRTSPHVTSFTEADVTNLVQWREKVKKEFEDRENEKLTFTPLFIEAIVKCIRRHPMLNTSISGDKIIVKKDINIGMATALPSGNLIVPVIRNADQLNLVGLTKRVNQLANAARNNKLRPDDTTDGSFTLTNVGTFGSLMGTPIINQPQVAILATGAIKKRPVVIETAQGDSIAIRHMMYLSMSYDHRIVDGALGATFLTAVARELENFDVNTRL